MSIPHRLPGYVLEMARCKAIHHDWDVIPNRRRAPWGTLMTQRCTTCQSVREDLLTVTGTRNGSANYDYSYNYEQLLEHFGDLTKDEWRVVYFRYLAKAGRKAELTGRVPVMTTKISNVTPIRGRRAGTAVS